MIKNFQNLSKDKKQKLVLTAVLSLIGVVVVANFYVLPQFGEMRASSDKIADLTTKIATEETKARQEAGNAAMREQYDAFVKQHSQQMITGDPFSWVVREVSLLAEGQPVKVVSMRPGALAEHGRIAKLQTFTAQIELNGSYDEVGSFISALENKFPTAEIRSVSLQAAVAGSKRLNASVGITFVLKEEVAGKQPTSEVRS
jgi:Tfp pilus assembly protein PilO